MHYCKTVTPTTIALWLKHRMKHISSSGPYLSSRKAANSASLLSPSKSCSHHLWNDAPIFILVFSLSNSLFLHCCSSSVLWVRVILSVLFLLSDVGNSGTFFVSVVVVVVCYPPLFWHKSIWPGKSQHCACMGEGQCWVRVCIRVINTSQTLPLALIGCI